MRVRLQKHPLSTITKMVLSIIIGAGLVLSQTISAEVINIPIQRTIATQPVTTLEIISIVKSLLSGRVLSIKKLSSYTNPDCHQVKLLEDKGEFQIIRLGCHIDTIVQAAKE
jgi:hypothetical protein